MQINYSDKDQVTIVRISDRIDANSSSDLETCINSLLDSGRKIILIDFSDVSYISSSGLRVLLSTLKKIKSLGGRMKLFCLKPFVMSVFKISGFNDIFEIYGDEEAALFSLEG